MAMAGSYGKTLHRRENPVGSIRCFRCRGLMVVEESFDSMASDVHADFPVRRCVQCGEVIDPVILHNRRLQLQNDPSGASQGRLL